MPTRIETPAALRRLIAFARREGWRIVVANGQLRSLRKPGLPAIHLGAPDPSGTLAADAASLSVPRVDKRHGHHGSM
ncbi:hypothetical protein ACCQ23_10350 [Xanthomonas axonopodis pv. phyllanthi]|uniref:hypothetical protein n=1 Tax=Xanthomonas axonopodis TaxID=53413 RepID=UPI003557C077